MHNPSYTINLEVSKKKRGRPAKNPVVTFEKQLEEWDKKEKQVDFQDLCQKLQNALAKSYVEAEHFEKNASIYQGEIARRDVIIQYLESKLV